MFIKHLLAEFPEGLSRFEVDTVEGVSLTAIGSFGG